MSGFRIWPTKRFGSFLESGEPQVHSNDHDGNYTLQLEFGPYH